VNEFELKLGASRFCLVPCRSEESDEAGNEQIVQARLETNPILLPTGNRAADMSGCVKSVRGVSPKWEISASAFVPVLITATSSFWYWRLFPWPVNCLPQGTTPHTLQSEQDPKPSGTAERQTCMSKQRETPLRNLSAKEKELLEAIRKLKARALRSFGRLSLRTGVLGA